MTFNTTEHHSLLLLWRIGPQTATCPHATRRGLLINEAFNDHEVYDSQEDDDQVIDDIHHTTCDKNTYLFYAGRVSHRKESHFEVTFFVPLARSKDVSTVL